MSPQPNAIGARIGAELQRRSTAAEVADILRALIFSGEIASGEALREAQLATSIGVSRQVVREALFRLEGDGLVERLPYKGTSVRTITADGVTDLSNVRMMVELTALDAVLAGPADDRARVVAAARAMAELAPDAWPQVIEADFRFHLALVEGLHSPRTTAFYRTLQGELRLCSAMTNQGQQYTHADYSNSHSQIATAIADRKKVRARDLLVKHLERARDDVLAALGER